MREFLNLTFSGLVTGSIYSIMAAGLILTYTTSGIFNLAHGAIAFATAYVYYQLHTGLGMDPIPAAMISVFVFAPLLGLLLDRIMLRRLAGAPLYARLVGTIGLLIALPNLVMWLGETVGRNVLGLGLADNSAVREGTPVPGIGPFPATLFEPFPGIVLGSGQLAVFVAAAVCALALWVVIRRTRLGLQMRAVVDRESLAGLRGVNAGRASAIAWILTMVLAGLGGVLLAPLFSLQESVFTLVVLGSLAAVVLGGFRSIPIGFVGGLVMGVLQNWIAGYSDRLLPEAISSLSGLKAAVPFLLTLILLLFFGRDRSRRGGTVAEEAPPADHRAGIPPLRRRLPWAIWTLILLAYTMHWIPFGALQASVYTQTWIAQGLAMAVIFLSFVVVTGLGGMVSLAQASFVTLGGFAAGWALSQGWGFLGAAALAVVVSVVVGMVVALPLTRLGGISLALGTLAIALVASLVVFPLPRIGNGDGGWAIAQPIWDVPVLNQINDLMAPGAQPFFDGSRPVEQILLFLGLFGLITAGLHGFRRSASGRAVLAVRSSEVAAAAAGVRVNRTKVLVFGLAAAIAGLGGVLLGLFSFEVSNATAPPMASLFWLALVVLFGVRRPGGALLAGLACAGGGALFHAVAGIGSPGSAVNQLLDSPHLLPILAGLGAVQLAQEPDGILSLVGKDRLARRRAKAAAVTPPAPSRAGHRAAGMLTVMAGDVLRPAALSLEGVRAGYGDIEVLHGVGLRLDAGTITALLGPNGAGKSTLCAVAAGLVAPTEGRVLLDGVAVSERPTYLRARDGLMLVPEARGIFPGLSVEENLRVMLADPAGVEAAYERFPILGERRNQVAGLLSGGEQQMLSLAPALVEPPRVLIADEPTLGLSPLVGEPVLEAIVELSGKGTAVLLVEEHAHNALRVADRIACMTRGRVVWFGDSTETDVDHLAGVYLAAAT
ncbi:ABC transporter permease subunit [Embleya scabrispora]|uniref:ABC transporter permease subunit n=1 Tax=Embleya scabrispora TaxID=159449 RepID=UPI000373ED3A|nr:ATP-binding cassette domain-containing protein [Embleya scabrispora]MYS79393.1 ATP-binding cassette domain-containing protein [Streptomyces sp. SID5474]